ncbi:hypothetical protein H257_15459 [Aphanomyces astaci]|uniref:Uncharacterized protein n=1 Tax=Aphanomyces astaci TaxID=112090 RepID=W4FPR4_APHAT|nr:hypothetical protein H257_15459 [Aphanomyces astaci]ETV68653.1 hypothetical protein H257_15459 [Aphanomyces astaci]|eukprot:XP_009841878.1 hypothetical protein H257_15459 [Aphanomyces astaci]
MEEETEDRKREITLTEELPSEQAAKQARLKEEMEQASLNALIHGWNPTVPPIDQVGIRFAKTSKGSTTSSWLPKDEEGQNEHHEGKDQGDAPG